MRAMSALYDLDDVAYGLTTYHDLASTDCEVCEGTGEVAVAGHEPLTAYCPARACWLGKVHAKSETLFAEIQPLTIGKITASLEAAGPPPTGAKPQHLVRYMAWETGVGSGTAWPEERLYATRKRAAEAARGMGAKIRPLREVSR